MYLVNTTFAVDPEFQHTWLDVMNGHYIPIVRDRGFNIVALSRVITDQHDGHFTYSLLVEADDMARYRELTEEIFPEYIKLADPLWGNSVVWFTSLMKKL